MEINFDPELHYGDVVELFAQAGETNLSLSFTSDHLAFDPLQLSENDYTSDEDQLPLVQTQPLQIVFDTLGNWEVTASNPECSTVSHGRTAKRFGFQTGKRFTCKIEIRQEHFVVFLNGYSLTSSEHLVPVGSIRTLSIVGDAEMFDVIYGNPIKLTRYNEKNFANSYKADSLVPKCRLKSLRESLEDCAAEYRKPNEKNTLFNQNGIEFFVPTDVANYSASSSSHWFMPSVGSSYQLVFDLEQPITSDFVLAAPQHKTKSEQNLLRLDDPEFFIDGGVQLDDKERQTTLECLENNYHENSLHSNDQLNENIVTDQGIATTKSSNQRSGTHCVSKIYNTFTEPDGSNCMSPCSIESNDKTFFENATNHTFNQVELKSEEQCTNILGGGCVCVGDEVRDVIDNKPIPTVPCATKVPFRGKSQVFISYGHRISSILPASNVDSAKPYNHYTNSTSDDFKNTCKHGTNNLKTVIKRSDTTKNCHITNTEGHDVNARKIRGMTFPIERRLMIEPGKSNHLKASNISTVSSINNTDFISAAELLNPILVIDLLPNDQNWIFHSPCKTKTCKDLSGTLSSIGSSLLDYACEQDKQPSRDPSFSFTTLEHQEAVEIIHDVLTDEKCQTSIATNLFNTEEHNDNLFENVSITQSVDHSIALISCTSESKNNLCTYTNSVFTERDCPFLQSVEPSIFEQDGNTDAFLRKASQQSSLRSEVEDLQKRETVKYNDINSNLSNNTSVEFNGNTLYNFRPFPSNKSSQPQHGRPIMDGTLQKLNGESNVSEKKTENDAYFTIMENNNAQNSITGDSIVTGEESEQVIGRISSFYNVAQTSIRLNGAKSTIENDHKWNETIAKSRRKNNFAAKLFVKKTHNKTSPKNKQDLQDAAITDQSNSSQFVRNPSFKRFFASSRKWIDNKISNEGK